MRYQIIHGHAKSKNHPPSRIYRIWSAMIRRCHCSKHVHYHRYGGRGITVCPEWRNSFSQFLKDMGPSHQEGLTLDRIKNNLGYSKENCRWATLSQQRRNSSFVQIIDTPKGPMHSLDASREFGIPRTTLMKRLERGDDPFSQTHYPKHKCLRQPRN